MATVTVKATDEEMTPVLVSIVTCNHEVYIKACLESVLQQTVPVRTKLIDNASRDDTLRRARSVAGVEIEESGVNLGYSVAHNRNLKGERFSCALLLNPDVVLTPAFLETVLETLADHPEVGLAGGKLLRMDDHGRPVRQNTEFVLDSTGIYFTPQQRHFDRGSNEPDRGQYDRVEAVFGITGAALLVRRPLYDDFLEVEGEFLDEDFFAYREDADLSWRARLRGWEALYIPDAVAYHSRRVLPEGRRTLDWRINYHSLKNRFLMRRKNMDRSVFWRCFPHMWIRDAGIIAYVLVVERSSIGVWSELRRLRTKFNHKRLLIQGGRRVDGREIAWWFSYRPRSRSPDD